MQEITSDNVKTLTWLTQLSDGEMESISGGWVANETYIDNCWKQWQAGKISIANVKSDVAKISAVEVPAQLKNAKAWFNKQSTSTKSLVRAEVQKFKNTPDGKAIAMFFGC